LNLYILTVGKDYSHYLKLPHDDYIQSEYLRVSDYLRNKGFEHYEVSNFAKPDKKSLHNQAYWKGQSYFSIGDSATGQFRSGKEMHRYKWPVARNNPSWEVISEAEIDLELIYTALRSSGLELSKLASKQREVIQNWEKRGFAQVKEDRIMMTPRGWIILDSLVAEIL